MTFSLLTSICRLFRRRPELAIPASLWATLLTGLRARGRGVRESGAFLLGPEAGSRRVTSIVFYDEIDSHAFDTGIIVIDGGCMADLWRICRARGAIVVADVHTHPGGAWQSESDRLHPMIAEPGHVAIIIPDFAADPVSLKTLGIYRYLTNFRWVRLKQSFFRPAITITKDPA